MWPGYMYRPQQPQSNQPAWSEHSSLQAAKNPDIKLDAKELFRELERDYGPAGKGLNFGATLIPLFRDIQGKIPSGTEITVSQFHEILRTTDTFSFVDRVARDRGAAIDEIVEMTKRLAEVAKQKRS